MNRAERRKQIKKLNTHQKLEQFSAELERRLRQEYNEKARNINREFIKFGWKYNDFCLLSYKFGRDFYHR